MKFSEDFETIESGDYILYNKDGIPREEKVFGKDEIYTVQV